MPRVVRCALLAVAALALTPARADDCALLAATLQQHEALINSLERALRASREETASLRAAVATLEAAVDARAVPERADSVLAANGRALKREARRLIAGAAPAGGDGFGAPLELTIRCAGGADVTTAPLSRDDAPGGECLVVDFAANDASARFALYCEDDEGGAEGDGEGGGGGGGGAPSYSDAFEL
jgi:hypothetical protein